MDAEQIKPRNQFDLSHVVIAERLQGSKLASFPRRAIAYGIDWMIILTCTEYFVLLFPLLFVFLFFKKKLRTTLVKNRRLLRKNIDFADKKLEAIAIEPRLRAQFRRHMTVYLYAIIYVPLIVAVVALLMFFLSFISEQTYLTTQASLVASMSWFVRPLTDLSNAMGLVVSFFGAFVYFTFFTWRWQGQTPAKRFLKIKVVKLNGKEISLWGSLERVMGYTASASLVGLGFFQYFWDRNCQTTHDKITETIVIEA